MARELRDQTQDLYRWEDQWLDWNRKQITVSDCRRLIRKACRAYKVPAPTVMAAHIKCRMSYYHSLKHSIHLNRVGQNISVALHEAAHAIVMVLSPRAEDHGPTFMGVYLNLLSNIGLCPPQTIYLSARKAGLRWDDRLVSRRKKARG